MSIQSPEAPALPVHRLMEQQARNAEAAVCAPGRRATTVVARMEGLRIMLVSLAAGGDLPNHTAPGPISVQPLQGEIEFGANGASSVLRPGDLITLGAGVVHSVRSAEGGSFLLTIAVPR